MEFDGSMLTSYVRPVKKPLKKGERSASGGVWCMMLLPLCGLFLEMYAVDKYSGAVLWLAVIVMTYVCAAADLRQLKKDLAPEEADKLRKFLVLPPLYLFFRYGADSGQRYKAIVMVILSAAAVFSNGFTRGLALTEEKMTEAVVSSTASVLDNFSGYSDAVIDDSLAIWLGKEYTSDCVKSGDIYTVVFSGTHEGSAAKITIEVEHDGFIYKAVKAKSVEIGGKALEGDELNDTLSEIFIRDDAYISRKTNDRLKNDTTAAEDSTDE